MVPKWDSNNAIDNSRTATAVHRKLGYTGVKPKIAKTNATITRSKLIIAMIPCVKA